MTINVLAIDDSRTIRDMLRQALEGDGITVTTAEDGRCGVAARRVKFKPTTGAVRMLLVPRSEFMPDREKPEAPPTPKGEITLF
jgi:DNA-binding NtrC family response regulator